MPDNHDPSTRSYNMSRIRAKDTKPELLVRRYLHAHGFRYKLHDKSLPGKPDMVLPKYNAVVFVHGCFWHGHEGCKYYVVPKTRTEWWLAKLATNIRNDEKAVAVLKEKGWNIISIWECELKSAKIEATLSNLVLQLRSSGKRK